MKKYLVLFLAFLPALLFAQKEDNDSKYLVGAVPVVEGKVTFSQTFNIPYLSETQIYDAMSKWCQKRFHTNEKEKNWGRVLYSNQERGQIACKGDEYLVFADKALSLDRAKITYRLTLLVEPGKCNMTIDGIYYDYEEKKLVAEEWITDENALNKDKTKLTYGLAKFRKKTVDLADNLFDEAQKALGMSALSVVPAEKTKTTAPITSTPVANPVPKNTNTAQSSMPGYHEIAAEQIPQNAVQLMSGNTIGFAINYKDVFNTIMLKANWGGIGYLFDSPAAFCFFAQEQAIEHVDKAETYALKFYANNQTEPWMIIECQKINNQPVQVNTARMIVGKILKVWIK